MINKIRNFLAFRYRTAKRAASLWKLTVFDPLLRIDVNLRKNISSKIMIDICIPVSEKDISKLPSVLEHALVNIKHPINKIFIIAAQSNDILYLCKTHNVFFVNENTIMGYNKSHLNYMVNGIDRSGWLFQQLLKLNADTIAEMDNFLILDADTCFIRPRVFIHQNKTILDVSTEHHAPYHNIYEKILKRKTSSMFSFITHYMLFNKQLLKKLKEEIERINNKKWDEVILQHLDKNEFSGFSEYELYGNYVSRSFPSFIKKEYWFNAPSALRFSDRIKSVSSHSYN